MWPDNHPPLEYADYFSKRVVILIRNPEDAMASWFNYLWEFHHFFPSHTVQAPERDWIKWRDQKSHDEYTKFWKGLLHYWKNLDEYEIAMYLPYERLVNIDTGPELLSKLAAELRANGVRVAEEKDIPCLWYQVVKNRKSTTKRAAHRYTPGYTKQQKAGLLSSLAKMQQYYGDDAELVDILQMYVEDVQNNIRVMTEDDYLYV